MVEVNKPSTNYQNVTIKSETEAIDNSIDSLVNFLDKLIKCIHESLEQLEDYYQIYMSAVVNGNVQSSYGKHKKVEIKYNNLKNSLNQFLVCITKDYADLIQYGYEIRSSHQKFKYYMDYFNKISNNENNFNELSNVVSRCVQLKKKLDRLVLSYNGEVTKLSYLKLNLRFKVIVYRSTSTGQSFSIPIDILIRRFKNFIEYNNLLNIGHQIHSSLLEQPLNDMPLISQEPELIPARSVHLDPSINSVLFNTPNNRINYQAILSTSKEEGAIPPRVEPPREKRSENVISEFTGIGQPSGKDKTPPRAKHLERTRTSSQNVPSGIESMNRDIPLTEVRKRKPDLTTPEFTEPLSSKDQPAKAKMGKQSSGSGDEVQSSVVENEMDVTSPQGLFDPDFNPFTSFDDGYISTSTLGTPENIRRRSTTAMPSLMEELAEVNRTSTSSDSSSQVEPRIKNVSKRKLLQKRRKFSLRIPMKASSKNIPKTSLKDRPSKPIPELIEIDRKKIITREFYKEIMKKLKTRISDLEEKENIIIIQKNENLCTSYKKSNKVIKSRKDDQDKLQQEIDGLERILNTSSGESMDKQQDLIMKKELLDKIEQEIDENKMEIQRIKKLILRLDRQDFDIQRYKNILYDGQRLLTSRWKEQLSKNLKQQTETSERKKLKHTIKTLELKIEDIDVEIKVMFDSYDDRKRRRIWVGPDKGFFCMKKNIAFSNIITQFKKKHGKSKEHELVDLMLAQREGTSQSIKDYSSAPVNILAPRRQPRNNS